jgi:hypothetical protein
MHSNSLKLFEIYAKPSPRTECVLIAPERFPRRSSETSQTTRCAGRRSISSRESGLRDRERGLDAPHDPAVRVSDPDDTYDVVVSTNVFEHADAVAMDEEPPGRCRRGA